MSARNGGPARERAPERRHCGGVADLSERDRGGTAHGRLLVGLDRGHERAHARRAACQAERVGRLAPHELVAVAEQREDERRGFVRAQREDCVRCGRADDGRRVSERRGCRPRTFGPPDGAEPHQRVAALLDRGRREPRLQRPYFALERREFSLLRWRRGRRSRGRARHREGGDKGQRKKKGEAAREARARCEKRPRLVPGGTRSSHARAG